MLKEFREFAIKGNMIDLAVAVVLGAAFGAIIASLTKDILNPLIGLALGHIDFNNMMLVMKDGTPPGPYATPADAAAAKAVTLNYGSLISTIINFFIVALCLFFVVKAMNALKKKQEEAPAPKPTNEEVLLAEIRDLLAKK